MPTDGNEGYIIGIVLHDAFVGECFCRREQAVFVKFHPDPDHGALE